jgi:conjugal transfer/type IV secretion protein DotA/TraY
MIEFFAQAIAPNDQSVKYLYQLFGDMSGLISSIPASGGSPVSMNILAELFRTFNLIALGIGTLIVVYATVVGVLKTAVEGEFLGRQWNSLWIPLRMVLGIPRSFHCHLVILAYKL